MCACRQYIRFRLRLRRVYTVRRKTHQNDGKHKLEMKWVTIAVLPKETPTKKAYMTIRTGWNAMMNEKEVRGEAVGEAVVARKVSFWRDEGL